MAEKIKAVSPSGSLAGWEFKKWASYNKDTLKAIAIFVLGYSYFTGFDWQTFIAGFLTAGGKLLIDTIDFYLTDVEL